MVSRLFLYLWQLPQNILGLLVILFSRAKKYVSLGVVGYDPITIYKTKRYFGVSLGNYIILNEHCNDTDIKHEHGHQIQSRRFGWLYLLVIGLPSAIGNLWDRLFHNNWTIYRRSRWYYSLPWESGADRLGDVNRW